MRCERAGVRGENQQEGASGEGKTEYLLKEGGTKSEKCVQQ